MPKLDPQELWKVMKEQAAEDEQLEKELAAVSKMTEAQLDDELRAAGLEVAQVERTARALHDRAYPMRRRTVVLLAAATSAVAGAVVAAPTAVMVPPIPVRRPRRACPMTPLPSGVRPWPPAARAAGSTAWRASTWRARAIQRATPIRSSRPRGARRPPASPWSSRNRPTPVRRAAAPSRGPTAERRRRVFRSQATPAAFACRVLPRHHHDDISRPAWAKLSELREPIDARDRGSR